MYLYFSSRVNKSFGRNQVLRGLNMSLPENRISMIPRPLGHRPVVLHQHIVGLWYPEPRRDRARPSIPSCATP